MVGIEVLTNSKYKTYYDKLRSSVAVSEGQLHYLNQLIEEVIVDTKIDNNEKFYQVSKIYFQMLRIFYTIDRLNSVDQEAAIRDGDAVDYVTGSASIDLHEFVEQCRSIDAHIKSVNQEYARYGQIQKVAVNPTIGDQAALWISNLGNEFVSKNRQAQIFFFSESYQKAIDSLEPSEELRSHPSMSEFMLQEKNDSWKYILKALRSSYTKDIDDEIIVSPPTEDGRESYREFLAKKSHKSEEKTKDNIFSKHYSAFVKPKTNIAEVSSGLTAMALTNAVDNIGNEHVNYISKVTNAAILGRSEYSQDKHYKVISGDEKENMRMEKTLLSILVHMQVQAINANLNETYGYEIYDNEKLLRNFIVDGKIDLPTSIDSDQMKFFMSILNEVKFLNDSAYGFYKELYASYMNSEDKSSLQKAVSYLDSPAFKSRMSWMEHQVHLNAQFQNLDKSRMFSRFVYLLKRYAFSVNMISSQSNARFQYERNMLTQEQWSGRFSGNQDYENIEIFLQNYVDFTCSYDVHSLRSLAIMDRHSVSNLKPLQQLDVLTDLLRYSESFNSLPEVIRAKIISEYLLFDDKFAWEKDAVVFNKVTKELGSAINALNNDHYALVTSYDMESKKVDETKIFDAIRSGNSKQLKFLLDNGSSLDQISQDGLTPMQLAVRIDNVVMLKRLMLAVKSTNGKYPLPLKFAVESNSMESVRFMVGVIGTKNIKSNVLHTAVKSKNIPMVATLLELGVNTDIKDQYGNLAIDYVEHSNNELRDVLEGEKPVAKIAMAEEFSSVSLKNNGKSFYKNLAQYFAKKSEGGKLLELIVRSMVYVSLIASIGFFVAAFIWPVNLYLNLAMAFCYLTVILESYVTNVSLPSSTKINNIQLNHGIIGKQQESDVNVPSVLLFPLEKALESSVVQEVSPIFGVKTITDVEADSVEKISFDSCIKV